MHVAGNSSVSLHLVALALSSRASDSVERLRGMLWKLTEDLSFLFLFPLIPLAWIPDTTPRIARHTLDPPILPLQFSSLQVIEDHIFLYPANEATHATLAQYASILRTENALPSFTVPLPCASGIYLGKMSELAIGYLNEIQPTIIVDDVRLQRIIVERPSQSSWQSYLRYKIIEDRHLRY